MEEKEVSTVRKITGELIGGFILYSIVFSILYNMIFSLITKNMSTDSLVLQAIIAIVLQGVCVFLIWRSSIKSTFKKRSILESDVPKVLKNMMIFTVILCVLSAFINYTDLKENLEEVENRISKYTYYMYDDAKDEIKDELEESKSKLYTYWIVLEIGLFVVYISMIPLQKKVILENSVLDESEE